MLVSKVIKDLLKTFAMILLNVGIRGLGVIFVLKIDDAIGDSVGKVADHNSGDKLFGVHIDFVY